MTSVNSNSLSLTNFLYSSNSKAEEAALAEKTLTPKVAEPSAVTKEGGAYNLDLSAEAQAYLKSLEGQKALPENKNKDYGFTLTPSEKKQLDQIVANYADKPYTQENFNKLQADLKAARLDNLNLAAKDMVRSFNSTSVLMSALRGDMTMMNAADRLKGQETKATNYTDQVAKDWYNQIAIEVDQM